MVDLVFNNACIICAARLNKSGDISIVNLCHITLLKSIVCIDSCINGLSVESGDSCGKVFNRSYEREDVRTGYRAGGIVFGGVEVSGIDSGIVSVGVLGNNVCEIGRLLTGDYVNEVAVIEGSAYNLFKLVVEVILVKIHSTGIFSDVFTVDIDGVTGKSTLNSGCVVGVEYYGLKV